jgi:hypothetical protein
MKLMNESVFGATQGNKILEAFDKNILVFALTRSISGGLGSRDGYMPIIGGSCAGAEVVATAVAGEGAADGELCGVRTS